MAEIWRDIKGFEGIYQVSNIGRVKSLERYVPSKNGSYRKEKEKIRAIHLDKYGYFYIILCNSGNNYKRLIHRLVAEAFIPNPNNYPIINHKDEIKTNNMIWVNEDGSIDYDKSNLEWCDVQYNTRYSLSKSIIQFSKDNKIINIWDVITDAANNLKINKSQIIKCCKRKPKHNTAGGYKWQYLDDYLSDWLYNYQLECEEKEIRMAC